MSAQITKKPTCNIKERNVFQKNKEEKETGCPEVVECLISHWFEKVFLI
jgi:hypothetical protein